MAKSKILKELVNEETSLNIALKRLIVLAADINDNDLKEWAEKEINGYNADDEVPEYRKLCSHYGVFAWSKQNEILMSSPVPESKFPNIA